MSAYPLPRHIGSEGTVGHNVPSAVVNVMCPHSAKRMHIDIVGVSYGHEPTADPRAARLAQSDVRLVRLRLTCVHDQSA
jgi:hypothetical protein